MALSWFGHLRRDVLFGARGLFKSPAFAAIAIGSVALGIGATAAMYSVIYAVIIDPFPYKDVKRLVTLNLIEPGARFGRSNYSVDQLLEISERNKVFAGVIASTISDVTWIPKSGTGPDYPQRLRGNHGTSNTFDVMGVPPLIGRTPLGSDVQPGAEPVAVLGYRFWQRQFGGDSSVLGLKMQLNGVTRTVIGVMPQRFMWRGADVYLPLAFRRGQVLEDVRNVHVLARLKPGVNDARALADLTPIFKELEHSDVRGFPKNWRLQLRTFPEAFPSDIADTLWILFGAVGLLLLIACVNVSNLLLSRAAQREREIAIRASMGASRSRLVAQLLAESLVLGVVGGALGVAFAYAGLDGIVAMVPVDTIPDESKIAMSVPVLLFTLGVSVVAAVLFGLAPALHLAGPDLATPLKESARSSGGLRRRLLRSGLVVSEVAVCLMLLVGATLMIRTLLAVTSQDLGGIPTDHLLTMRIPSSRTRYPTVERRNALVRGILANVEGVPGVSSAAINFGLIPLWGPRFPIEVAGAADSRRILFHAVSEHYPETMGMKLAQGRFFSEQEIVSRSHFAVVNQSFAQRYYSNRPALGGVVKAPRLRDAPFKLTDDSFQIVGIVKDTTNQAETGETLPEILVPYTVAGQSETLMIRAQGDPSSVLSGVRSSIYAQDSEQPVMEVKTLRGVLSDYVFARPRFNLLLFGIFASIGLILALSGIYGVISSGVAQRSREIGIRMALGATLPQIAGMVLSGGARLVALGIVIGLAGSLASVRVLASQVTKVSPFDPYSFAAVTVLLFAAGLFASFWPARRAARVDPAIVLRHE